MTDWPEYESHKVVRAAKITRIVTNDAGEIIDLVVLPEDGVTRERFMPTEPAMLKRAEVDGYAMLYPDGFKSISPAKAFEEGYTRKP